jgi:putative FmdB family regulatory protein
MPTYEYVCAKCGHEFEKFQPIADKTLKICPEDLCAKKKWGRGSVKRKISTGGGLIFKGSGFYITDYRSEGYKQAAKKDSDAAKPASSDTKTSSTDSKPASPKTDAKAAKPSTQKT